jgi:ribosomal protein S27E
MASDPVECANCGERIEDADDLEPDGTVHEIDLEPPESGDGPRIVLGAGQRDLWRCRSCGKVLGVS